MTRGSGQGHAARERSGPLSHWASESGRKHYLEQKSCINISKHILEFLNYVIVRVLINNYNYKRPIALFIIFLANKHLCYCVIQCNRCFANYFYFTHFYGVPMDVLSTIVTLGRSHLICSCLLGIESEVCLSTIDGTWRSHLICSY